MPYRVCISHDIDHLSLHDHHRDLSIPKFIAVGMVETLKGRRNLWSQAKVKATPIKMWWNDTWNCIEELLELEKKHKMPSTYFFVMRSGKGVNYNEARLHEAIGFVKKHRQDLGVHGQAFDDLERMREEVERFKTLTGQKETGIRMHYLRNNATTYDHLKSLRYKFDSTEFSKTLKQPYRMKNGLLEIPLHIMDTYLFSPFYSNMTITEAQEHTLSLFADAKKGNKLVNIMFHQRSLSTDLPRSRAWIQWLYRHIATDEDCTTIRLSDVKP
ncbi:MAG: hypothetical protein ABIH41_03710 [Nanoarchaeota archaeon]